MTFLDKLPYLQNMPWLKSLLVTFSRFLGAGAVGFCVDACVFFTLTQALQVAPLMARLAASAVAIVVTWSINRRYAFADARRQNLVVEFVSYFAASLVGAGANLGGFALMAPYDGAYLHIPAYVFGTGAALIANFVLYRYVVFRGDKQTTN